MLIAMLRRRGVSPDTCEDVVQETAARVLTSGVGYVDAADLFRWASTVARRVYVDMLRKDKRLDFEPPPDTASPVDVHLATEERIALAEVRRAFKRLSPRDREAILSGFALHDGASNRVLSRKEAVKLNVQRHRARERLRSLLSGVGGLGGLVVWLGRRWPRVRTSVAIGLAVPVLCLSVLLAYPSLPGKPTRLPSVTTDADESARHSATPARRDTEMSPGAAASPIALGEAKVSGHSKVASSAATSVTRIEQPTPVGQPVWVQRRESQPTDHLACAFVDYHNVACIDQPGIDTSALPTPPPLP